MGGVSRKNICVFIQMSAKVVEALVCLLLRLLIKKNVSSHVALRYNKNLNYVGSIKVFLIKKDNTIEVNYFLFGFEYTFKQKHFVTGLQQATH